MREGVAGKATQDWDAGKGESEMTVATTANSADRAMVPYNEAVVRQFVVAALFWGIVGFTVGVYIALQLGFPILNLNLEWTTFGRLRPIHTSAVVFAFGGNVLIGTSIHLRT